jgi:hypothetical protein
MRTFRDKPTIDRLIADIQKKRDESAKLQILLAKSLAIQDLWPDAFKGGSTVSVRIGTHTCREWDMFLAGRLEITTARLVRANDGAEYPITPEQFRVLHFFGEK